MKWDAEKYDATHTPQFDPGREPAFMTEIREDDSVIGGGCGTAKITFRRLFAFAEK